MASIQRGDQVTTTEYPEDYPLIVVVVAGGRLAIGSPRWPVGATWPMEYHQITGINGFPVSFAQITKSRRRKAA